MEEEAKRRLSKAIELVHNAQAELLEAASPESREEGRRNVEKAVGMLVETIRILAPDTGPNVRTPSGYLWSLGLRMPA
jgi:hypothetical protein